MLHALLSRSYRGSTSLLQHRGISQALRIAKERSAPLDIHPEVEHALATNAPVVALETALVTHGFPYPGSLQLALSLEKIVRSTGSIPATVGVLNGRIKIGLNPSELERLASNTSAVKVSRRDIAVALAKNADGGTTCSATLIFSALSGIKIFATGGLGGVHRGGESSLDVSADLQELSRCPVGLISAGVKSILDIGRTLEYLETLGVPVLAYGPTTDFPAFFSPRSGFQVPWNVSNPEIAAQVLHTQWQLGMENGAVIAVPIPREYESNGALIQKAVDQAVAESEVNGVSRLGKDATPWLLNRVGELTAGKSLASNIALLENTALIGGKIAVQYSKLLDHDRSAHSVPSQSLKVEQYTTSAVSKPPARLVVIGAAAVDISAQANIAVDEAMGSGSTMPGTVAVSLGGVGRNIAEAAHRVLTNHSKESVHDTLLISATGDDAFGRMLRAETQKLGMSGSGNLISGIADMDIAEALNDEQLFQVLRPHQPSVVILDVNLSSSLITNVLSYCSSHDIHVFFDPTSVVKSTRILPAIAANIDKIKPGRTAVTYSSPNLIELTRLYHASRTDPYNLTDHSFWWQAIDAFSLGTNFRMELDQLARMNVSDQDPGMGSLAFIIDEGTVQMAVNLLPFFQHLIIKCGDRGIIIVMRISNDGNTPAGWVDLRSNPQERYICTSTNSLKETIVVQHYPALVVEKIVNVTGAGDSFAGTLVASLLRDPGLMRDPTKLRKAVKLAQCAAVLTLKSPLAVAPQLSQMADQEGEYLIPG